MTQLPGPEKADCPCGCGRYGKPVKSRRGHIRGCTCKPCLAGRNSQSGKRTHRRLARQLAAMQPGATATSEEERWNTTYRYEVKSGAQVGPVVTKYRNAKQQSMTHKAFGDPRPFAFIASHDGLDLVVVELDVWKAETGEGAA